jgi:hypothetical protein
MLIGKTFVGGICASGTEEKEEGRGDFVLLFVIARRAKSYSPVPRGSAFVRTSGFA